MLNLKAPDPRWIKYKWFVKHYPNKYKVGFQRYERGFSFLLYEKRGRTWACVDGYYREMDE
jgi:hypothetical protein